MSGRTVRIGVSGSRQWQRLDLIDKHILRLWEHYGKIEIISGGGGNVDRHAERFAYDNQLPKQIFLPDWDTYGKSAGFRRNRTIVDHSDVLIAFWDGVSPGTKSAIQLARQKVIDVMIVYPDERTRLLRRGNTEAL